MEHCVFSSFQNDFNEHLGLQPLTRGRDSVQQHQLSVSLGFSLLIYKISKNDAFGIGKFEELNVTVDIKLLSILFYT